MTSEYVDYIPKKCELNCDAPNIPGNYLKPFKINTHTRQNPVGNLRFMKPNENIYNYTDNSYKSIARPPHVNLNLLASSINTNKKSGILHISMTTRMKEKYVTYIYYKPVI